MQCPKCHSENVNVQMVSESKLKRKRSALYWIFIGWWLNPILWVVMFIPMLFIKLFRPKSQKLKTIHKSMWVCQNCGYSWVSTKRQKNKVASAT
jgi:predicted nucleic-acid-binding Zn-ribbon protein